jgi:hypothetical protein
MSAAQNLHHSSFPLPSAPVSLRSKAEPEVGSKAGTGQEFRGRRSNIKLKFYFHASRSLPDHVLWIFLRRPENLTYYTKAKTVGLTATQVPLDVVGMVSVNSHASLEQRQRPVIEYINHNMNIAKARFQPLPLDFKCN